MQKISPLKEKLKLLAKTRNRRTNGISDNIYISDADGNIRTDHEKIKDRWQEYFEELFNVTNARKELDNCDETDGPIPSSVNVLNNPCLHVITGLDYRVTTTAPEYDLLRAIRQRRELAGKLKTSRQHKRH